MMNKIVIELDMETMPKTCFDCVLCYDTRVCKTDIRFSDKRHLDCPLKEGIINEVKHNICIVCGKEYSMNNYFEHDSCFEELNKNNELGHITDLDGTCFCK